MKYVVTLNEKNYEVEVEKGEARVLSVAAAAPVAAAPTAPATPVVPTAPATPEAPAAVSADGEVVPAPMPGSIVNVVKNTGDAVKRGDVVVILEAMKMENEIVSPRDGVIAQVAVSRGVSVSTGTPLFVVK
jgi:glutaconyl-CoA decarboxylase